MARELELELGDADLARVESCLGRLASLQITARPERKTTDQHQGMDKMKSPYLCLCCIYKEILPAATAVKKRTQNFVEAALTLFSTAQVTFELAFLNAYSSKIF